MKKENKTTHIVIALILPIIIGLLIVVDFLYVEKEKKYEIPEVRPMTLDVIKDESVGLKKVTNDKFYDKYGYDIYFYKVNKFVISKYTFLKRDKDIIKALNNGEKTMDEILGIITSNVEYKKAIYEKDINNEYEKYIFDTFCLIKYTADNGNIYIGPQNMQLSDLGL